MPPAAGIPVLQGGEDVNGMRSVSSLFLCGRCVRKAGGGSGLGRAKVRLFLKTGGEDCGPGGRPGDSCSGMLDRISWGGH